MWTVHRNRFSTARARSQSLRCRDAKTLEEMAALPLFATGGVGRAARALRVLQATQMRESTARHARATLRPARPVSCKCRGWTRAACKQVCRALLSGRQRLFTCHRKRRARGSLCETTVCSLSEVRFHPIARNPGGRATLGGAGVHVNEKDSVLGAE